MTIDNVIAPELLSAEIEAIEDLLVHYEDWRALSQLEIRERQAEVPNSVSTNALKTMLIEKLAHNPLFMRRQTLLKELERLTQSVRSTPAQSITQPLAGRVRDHADGDDLTRIRGIDLRLERRLNALNIRSFAQIARFTLDDVRYVSSTLGLENRIISQMWIEQAEMLVNAQSNSAGLAEAQKPVLQPILRSEPAVEVTVAHPSAAQPHPHNRNAKVAPERAPPPEPADRPKLQPAMEEEAEATHPTGRAEPADAPKKTPVLAATGPAAAVPEAKVQKPEPAVSATTAQPAEVPERDEPKYDHLSPPRPFPASQFKAEPPEVPTTVAVAEAVEQPPPIADFDHTIMRPAFPLPASRFSGAVLEDHVDHGSLGGAAPPPKPRKAADYSVAKTEPSTISERLPSAVQTNRGAAPAAPPQPSGGETVKLTEPRPASEPKRAAEIATENIPALPFRPGAAASPPPPPLPRQTVTSPPAAARPHAASPQPQINVPPLAPASPALAYVSAAAAAAAKEAAMLAAAAARTGSPAAASAPPPLPPGASYQTPLSAPPLEIGSPQLPRVGEDRSGAVSPRAGSHGANEARVTIRRPEESGTILRTSGATEVHLRRDHTRQSIEFDSASYAAYHTEVEEASVQIVRKKERPPLANPPAASTVSATAGPPPIAKASSPEALAAPAAGDAKAKPLPELPSEPKTLEKAAAPIGRFLRALTGQ